VRTFYTMVFGISMIAIVSLSKRFMNTLRITLKCDEKMRKFHIVLIVLLFSTLFQLNTVRAQETVTLNFKSAIWIPFEEINNIIVMIDGESYKAPFTVNLSLGLHDFVFCSHFEKDEKTYYLHHVEQEQTKKMIAHKPIATVNITAELNNTNLFLLYLPTNIEIKAGMYDKKGNFTELMKIKVIINDKTAHNIPYETALKWGSPFTVEVPQRIQNYYGKNLEFQYWEDEFTKNKLTEYPALVSAMDYYHVVWAIYREVDVQVYETMFNIDFYVTILALFIIALYVIKKIKL